MIIAAIPSRLAARKPPHGAPCTRCGVCCLSSKCDLGKKLFGGARGPCPGLKWEPGEQSYCDVARNPTGYVIGDKHLLSLAAKLLLGASAGCDMVLRGEPRNAEHDRKWLHRIAAHMVEYVWAHKLWGI